MKTEVRSTWRIVAVVAVLAAGGVGIALFAVGHAGLAVAGAVAAALVGPTLGFVVPAGFDAAARRRTARAPLAVEVRTDVDSFDWQISHVPEYIVPGPLESLPAPPHPDVRAGMGGMFDRSARNRYALAHSHGGVDATSTLLRLTIQGRSETPVILQRLEVVIHKRQPPCAGFRLSIMGIGSAMTPDVVYVNLDRPNAPLGRAQAGSAELRPFLYRVDNTDTQIIDVLASTGTDHVFWSLLLHYTFEGKAGQLDITNGGAAFETSGAGNSLHTVWDGTAWRATSPNSAPKTNFPPRPSAKQRRHRTH